MPLASGTRLGSYEVISPLGAGGMGEVYRAHDSRLGRDVAIKLLPDALASSPDRLARFEREARTVAGLNHPNIVTVHAIEEVGGVRFLSMELVEGRDLSSLIAPNGLTLAQVLEIAIPLADALVAAHERRVVHRDLKPANVMLTRDGRVKVLDFGLAKLTEIGADLDLTRAENPLALSGVGQVVGTVPYMAPEQIRGEAVDARTDLFSFGILVYELATGKRPFAGQTYVDVSSAILHNSPSSLTSARADLPPDLGRILDRCLEKNPRERFQTALDLANELRGLKRTIEHGAPTKPPPSDKIASIAVLPFVNRSASPEDEYFSDGLADELLNVLTKIRGLRVAARTSAFHFKGKDTTIAEVGQALHVDTVLEGTVRKAGQRVRIAVQLVKVSDGYHLWSESYDRTLDDIFALQDDIAQSVVKELRRTLLGEEADSKASGEVKAEISQAARGRTTNPEAYRLCLQARHLLGRFTRTDTAKAIEYLKHALELDPDFALGWAELSRAYSSEAARGWVPVTEGISRARQAVELALALEPGLGEAHSALGWIQQVHDWDWQGAETSYRRAMELSPGNTTVLRRAGVLAAALGQFEEAMALFHRAIDGDPLDSSSYHNLGLVLAASDRIEESEQAFRKALELATQRSTTHAYLSLSLLLMGRQEEALEVVKKEPNEGDRLPAQSIIEGALGNLPEADRLLRQLIETRAESEPSQIAEVYAIRGEKDEAFAWLERAFGARDAGVTLILQSPRLRSLHADPRWRALLEKLRLAK